MRIASGLLLLAATASLASAGPQSGVNNGLAQGQTTPELQCKRARQAFLSCALANDFNSTSNLWIDPAAASCYPAAATGLNNCRGGFAIEQDGLPATPGSVAFPSFAMAGGVAKSGQIKAQVLIPSGVAVTTTANTPKTPKSNSGLTKQNTHSLTCGGCAKLVARVVKCALPVAVADPTQAGAAYLAAVDACLGTDAKARVDWAICSVRPGTELVPNNGQLTYVVVASQLNAGIIQEACPSVEGQVTSKGTKSVNILKVPVGGGVPN